jgi:hypothetical protein
MQVYRRLSELKKYHIEARDGRIGKPYELYFDDHQWRVRYFVVHTGSWLLKREVLIIPDMVSGIDDKTNTLQIKLNRDQVENSPAVETVKPVSRYYEEQYYAYYGWQPYWSNIPLAGSAVKPLVPPAEEYRKSVHESPDINLRSSKAVTGYIIHAVNGEIGHVKDFIVGDEKWEIRYLEVDTGNWLPGRKVVISPSWITNVDWAMKEVTVKLTREAIENAPEYDQKQLISREYELEVFRHYSSSLDDTGTDK